MRIAAYVKLMAVLTLVALASIVHIEAQQQQQKRPSAEVQAYLEYRKAVLKAKRLEDIYYNLDRLTVEYYKGLSAPERTKIFQGLKAQVELFPEIQVVKEERTPQGVMLVLDAIGADKTKATVNVEILREGPALKVGPSAWK
jgi:hypothetical protein